MSKHSDSSSPHSGPENFPVMPGLELVNISPLGAIFRVKRRFEPGTSLALGVQLCDCPWAGAPRFLDLRGTVVECHRDRSPSVRGTCWQVTLLFHNVSDTDCSAIAAAQSTVPAKPAAAPFLPCGASFFGFEGFPPVCGLN
ncbi:MAG: hypothetical protein EOP86_14675 [Verrucomicrobiaceae bacterium]|nr:MAG: hypothetical protein EOP86_14675 [Verrucomicrobiaceae bacterium]